LKTVFMRTMSFFRVTTSTPALMPKARTYIKVPRMRGALRSPLRHSSQRRLARKSSTNTARASVVRPKGHVNAMRPARKTPSAPSSSQPFTMAKKGLRPWSRFRAASSSW
jgi:hypothetical protein